LGDTAIQSTVGATFSHPRPRIVARFSATRIGLENIGIFPAAPSVSPEATTAAQPHNSTPLFGDSPLNFEALKGYDVDFTLDAAELAGRNVGIRDLNLDIKLENGRLHMHPASLVYRAGFTEFDFTVDASGAVPEFELKITGEDIDIEEVLANAHEPLVLGGDLNVFVHLRSSGRSYREIATNLVGEVSLALEDGQIRRVINFLSADAFNLLLTVADRRQATDLNCLVGKIQFQEGVGGIDFFVMDTPRIKATAAGSVDLAAETVDVGIYPRVKRRLIRGEQSAVRIYGPLNQPSVSAWPLSEVAQLFGQVLISPVTLAERTLGSLWYVISKDAEASPCLR
jgi:uncharacterized protein involved in outer membrane biogenesis